MVHALFTKAEGLRGGVWKRGTDGRVKKEPCRGLSMSWPPIPSFPGGINLSDGLINLSTVMASVTHQSEALCPPLLVPGHLGLSHLIVTQLGAGWMKVTSITEGSNMSQESPPPPSCGVKCSPIVYPPFRLGCGEGLKIGVLLRM